MITEKLYYNDSYINEFSAVVLSCDACTDGFFVTLDKTAFFPEGGGQKADNGYIGDAFVKDVQEKNGQILHIVDKELSVCTEYNCKLDWQQRFNRMQNHSGEHIVSGIVNSLYGYDNVGFHMEEDYVTIDFNGELTREQLDEIEDKVNYAIYKNYSINCWFPDRTELSGLDYRSKLELTENVRLVSIENTDLCACCAPHVKSTGEVGIVKILDFMRHRGGIRLVMKAGSKALLDYREKYKSVYDISNLLSAKQPEVFNAVERVYNEVDDVNRELYNFKHKVAESDKNNLIYSGNISYFISSFYDTDMMRNLVNYGMEKSSLSLAFSGEDENGYSYIAGSNSLDMKNVARSINSNLNGRGGGRDTMIQGKVSATKEQIVNYLENNEWR